MDKFKKIAVEDGFFSPTVKTICTTASVFVNDKLSDDVVDTLSDALLNRKNFILKGE